MLILACKNQGVIILLYYYIIILLLLSLEDGAYHNFMFVLGFILSRHIKFTGTPRRLCKFDIWQKTKSYSVEL